MSGQNIFPLIAILALVGNASLARADHRDDHDIGRRVYSYRPHASGPKIAPKVVQCGDTISVNTALAADLICPTTTGFALNLVGSNITLDGNGHKIVAPLASAGLFVMGSGITVRALKISGISGGDGILAYETDGIRITGNDVSGNLQGIVLYADSSSINGAVIENNTARNNALFGVRAGFDAPGSIVNPSIRKNDVSGSGSYGLLLKTSKLELGGDENNTFSGSANGIYLAGGDVSLHDFSLARDAIQGVGIFADSLSSITVDSIDVSSAGPLTIEGGRIGIDLYRVALFSIKGITATGNDVGVKFETEHGVNCTGTVTGSKFTSNAVSGILVVSYDGTPYGLVNFVKNCFRLTATRVLVIPGVVFAPGSITDDGLNICGSDYGDRDNRNGERSCH